MIFCAKCGAHLEEGLIFCSNCGARVNAAPQNNPAPDQAQPRDVGGEVLKESELAYIFTGLKSEKGTLFLYRDRLEWKGDSIFSIPLENISSAKLYDFGKNFRIILNNGNKYHFTYCIGPAFFVGFSDPLISFNLTRNKVMKEWCDAINNEEPRGKPRGIFVG